MSLLKKEPALVAGVAAVIAVLLAYNLVTPQQAEAWEKIGVLLIVPLIQAVITRQTVFSPSTIEQAGLDPKEVQRRADDPSVIPLRKA